MLPEQIATFIARAKAKAAAAAIVAADANAAAAAAILEGLTPATADPAMAAATFVPPPRPARAPPKPDPPQVYKATLPYKAPSYSLHGFPD